MRHQIFGRCGFFIAIGIWLLLGTPSIPASGAICPKAIRNHQNSETGLRLADRQAALSLFSQLLEADTTPAKKRRVVELEIDGLVIDDTRSKIGRDFYDQFYSNWIPPNGASDFIITIKEYPARGRLVQVGLVINDNELGRRFLQPRQELIEETANLFIRTAWSHLRQQKDLKDHLSDPDQKGSGVF